jgi:3-deoxy-D-manno-octulosonic-acid transferase
LESIGIQQVSVVGDPRIDRVFELAKKPNHYPTVADFCGQKPVLVIGSSWDKDEAILMPFINENRDWKFIIAPHEIDENHLQNIENQCIKKIIRFSNLQKNDDSEVLLIDNIGMLSSLYQFGKIAYIGGGFGAGIHNTLEPMGYHLPVIFGTNYKKFEEANAMISAGGAFSITSTSDFGMVFNLLNNNENWEAASQQIQRYINENVGATEKVFSQVYKS